MIKFVGEYIYSGVNLYSVNVLPDLCYQGDKKATT